jgi:hypothetical protein
MIRETTANKVRVDVNVTAQTKHLLDGIVTAELEDDKANDRPERSRSMILEMILRKGARIWTQTRHQEHTEETKQLAH